MVGIGIITGMGTRSNQQLFNTWKEP